MTHIEHLVERMAAEAEAQENPQRCPQCKAALFYQPAGYALRKGHVYSKAGKAELGITGLCEFCFDEMESSEERAERQGVLIDPDVPHVVPLAGQVLQTVDLMSDNYGGADGRYATSDPERAYVITSEVDDGAPRTTHRPVLDIDFPAQLIPSSTPGHFHLYLDVEIPHDKYMALLDALALAGVIEPGYASASKARGYTAARLPWIKKRPSADELVDQAIAEQLATVPVADGGLEPWPF